MTTTGDIVAKLWSLCHILRDDGVTYNEYVTELTYLLFLKMLEETKKEDRLPKAYRWRELAKRDGLDQLDYYKRLLLDLGKPAPDGERLPKANLVLTNPPFGTKKGGGRPTRSDFSITADTSNKQLAFVEHVVRALKPAGRVGMVVPDNVLFEDNTGRRLRTWLMDLCNVHTILRLPTGIFYAQGVKTNVLFFQRGKTDKANTKAVWVYDMRANMPAFGKTRPLTSEDFADFERAYGSDPNGGGNREDEGEEGRWRCVARDAINARNDNLDISWLRDTEAEAEEQLTEPEILPPR
jgi:type I restriction enzyme M protein